MRNKNTILLRQINPFERYESDCGWVVIRVNGKVRLKDTDYDLDCNHHWVVYNPQGEPVDRDRYINDIVDRWNFKLSK